MKSQAGKVWFTGRGSSGKPVIHGTPTAALMV